VILIVGTLVIIKQLDFIQDKKLGFDRNHSIIVPLDSRKVFESFKAELLRNGLATHVARGSESPAQVLGGYAINREGESTLGIMTAGLVVDEEYIPAMGMEIVSGRNFTQDDVERAKRDTVYTFILNESALQHLSIDVNDAIGKRVAMGERKGEIIGVVRDFHFSSLHNLISPLVMFPEEDQLAKIFIKLAPGDVPEMLDKIKNISTTLMPHRPFEFEFLDQQYAALYVAEQRMGNIFIVFAVLAIVIACLGLLGLISFSAAQKTKEIGIRKVMGATGADIIMLITRDFTRLVVIAIALGLPLAYWIMTQWLSDFAYKTAIGTGPVITASLLCIFIALGTAAFQAIKAARGNPVTALREN
jgi:putative ABC transport system permease protein